ncbi:MAG: response regulator, partial [Lachnospiraceae bacterium]|nr:response regulator [Lachnospiraceae bacterium]
FECLNMVQKKKYDIIFLDHRMPEMDGIETLQKFNELEDNKSSDTPVIALTANALSGARETYIDAGFADYLTKPIDYKKLEKMIMDYLPCGKVKPADNENTECEESSIPEWIFSSNAINAKVGLQNCGSEETFLAALHNFYDAIDENSEKIENFYNEKDWHNYNIKVHALKSSARLIGAETLSSKAFSLEVASEDDGPNEGYIKIHHASTLELYRSYKEKLAALNDDSDNEENEADKDPISEEDLAEAFDGILELIESIDYETAEELIKSLDNYSIPDNSKDKYLQLKKYASAFDWNAAAELLKS